MLKLAFPMLSLFPLLAIPKTGLLVNFQIDPYFEGRTGAIHMKVDTDSYPGFFYFLRVQESEGLHYYVRSYFPRAHQGFQSFDIVIPTSLTSLSSFICEFGFSQYDPLSGMASTYLFVSQKELTQGTVYELEAVDEDGIFEPKRTTYVYNDDNPSRVMESSDYFEFSKSKEDAPSSTRFLPIFSLNLSYHAAVKGSSRLDKANAELRMLDHLDDFAPFGTKVGNSFVSIPLSLWKVYDNNLVSTYLLRLPREYAYSRVDGTLSGSSSLSFVSDQIVVPLRHYHDKEIYRYQLLLTHLGPYEDSFFLSGAATFLTRLYGPREGSQYSLKIGGANG